MSVDIGNVLHVLAHELRTPAGIAQGYVRLLLEGRLTDDVDRQRALEQTQKALSRVGELSREASTLATWLERDRHAPRNISPADLVDRLAHIVLDPPLIVRSELGTTTRTIRSEDTGSLEEALATMVRVTAREIRGACGVRAVADDSALKLFIGPDDQTSVLGDGPGAPGASPISLQRGGVGLTMVQAILVLEAHDANCWTVGAARNIVGIRLPWSEENLPSRWNK
jgi:signal transduction histidine kinase